MKTKPIKWTETDSKRAEKMGWFIGEWNDDGVKLYTICTFANCFKSDAEAAVWTVAVLEEPEVIRASVNTKGRMDLYWSTCRKAVQLCCGGGR